MSGKSIDAANRQESSNISGLPRLPAYLGGRAGCFTWTACFRAANKSVVTRIGPVNACALLQDLSRIFPYSSDHCIIIDDTVEVWYRFAAQAPPLLNIKRSVLML